MTMDDQAKADYERKSQNLRLELKQWENGWVKTHDGKKPGRADIKANEDIGTMRILKLSWAEVRFNVC
jgi:hypothetical protein